MTAWTFPQVLSNNLDNAVDVTGFLLSALSHAPSRDTTGATRRF
jgi:hypothetical protein